MSLWTDLLAAIQFSTRLPVPVYPYDELSLSRASKFFPLIGLVIGSAGAALYELLISHVNAQIRAVFVLVFFALATGGLHEDGLADAADGLGGGWTRDRVLEIMRDSRIGSYGALAIVLSLLARFVLLSNLAPGRFWRYVISAHVLCRWSTLPLGFALRPARSAEGSGAMIARRISPGSLILATLFAAIVEFWLLGRLAWLPWSFAVLVTALSGLYYWIRIGGVTGDCLGATNQLVEISAYLCGCL